MGFDVQLVPISSTTTTTTTTTTAIATTRGQQIQQQCDYKGIYPVQAYTPSDIVVFPNALQLYATQQLQAEVPQYYSPLPPVADSPPSLTAGGPPEVPFPCLLSFLPTYMVTFDTMEELSPSPISPSDPATPPPQSVSPLTSSTSSSSSFGESPCIDPLSRSSSPSSPSSSSNADSDVNMLPKRKRGRPRVDKSNRVCGNCGTQSTPEWRRGPKGPSTLCNACGIHYLKLKQQKTTNNGSSNNNKPTENGDGNDNYNLPQVIHTLVAKQQQLQQTIVRQQQSLNEQEQILQTQKQQLQVQSQQLIYLRQMFVLRPQQQLQQ